MEARISDHPVIIVLLDSWGKNSRVSDANRVKQWMEKASHS
jgi:D-alanyl-D-alanine endopeptidase (penicillin-binding protein 7)